MRCKTIETSIFTVNGDSLPGPLIIGTFEKRAPDRYIYRYFYCLRLVHPMAMGLLIYNCIQTNKLYSQAMFTLYRIAFAPPRESYRIELLFTHKNCCGGAFSVTEQSCAAPMCKVESQISKRCSHYIRELLRRHENHIGLGFCSHIKTAVAARFL